MDLCMVHGHLAFARFPVLVGHYSGDAFAGTEARLDRALNSSALRTTQARPVSGPDRDERHPASIRTASLGGAVVVGLGQPADLSIGTLRETLRQGILAYVVEALDRGRAERGPCGSKEVAGTERSSGRRRRGRHRPQQLRAGAASGDQPGERHARPAAKAGARLAHPRNHRTLSRIVPTKRGAIREEGDRGRLRSQGRLFGLRPSSTRAAEAAACRRSREDPNWWQPIQITMPPVEGRKTAASRSRSGAASRGRRRERSPPISTSSRPSCAGRPECRHSTARRSRRGGSCSNCCGPNSLKHRSAEEQNRRLILDERQRGVSVGIAGRPASLDERDDADAAGRSLVTVRRLLPPGWCGNCCRLGFRRRSSPLAGKPKALVIGDPGAEP